MIGTGLDLGAASISVSLEIFVRMQLPLWESIPVVTLIQSSSDSGFGSSSWQSVPGSA